MDWAGWAVFGLIATAGLTALMMIAQVVGLTRMDLPLMLGTIATADPDRARVVGFFAHLGFGQLFALGYALVFTVVDSATVWLGAALGLLHGVIALAVLVPLLPGVNPRMASSRAGPSATAALEPPGMFALNYGVQTPLVALIGHVAFGALLGLVLTA
jgi:uncharacterized membrane protein YagU involved in acid resistance